MILRHCFPRFLEVSSENVWTFGLVDGRLVLIRVSYVSGIDVNIVDNKNRTALDIVKEMPSQKSRQIAALIQGECVCV